jgi:hypothetical protein
MVPGAKTGPRHEAAKKARRGHGWPGGRKEAGTGSEQTRFHAGKQGVASVCDAECDVISPDRIELLAGGRLRGPPSPQPHMARRSVIQR